MNLENFSNDPTYLLVILFSIISLVIMLSGRRRRQSLIEQCKNQHEYLDKYLDNLDQYLQAKAEYEELENRLNDGDVERNEYYLSELLRQSESLEDQLKNKNYRGLISKLRDLIKKIPENQLEYCDPLSLIEYVWNQDQDLAKWEQERKRYQGLPNNLLAIGLLGTFSGISFNLFTLSQNTAGENLEIQKALSDIVSAMALAFISSLFALSCSIILQLFFPAYSLDIEKERLFNQLEYAAHKTVEQRLRNNTLKEKIEELTQEIRRYPKILEQLKEANQKVAKQLIRSSRLMRKNVAISSSAIKNSATTLNASSDKLIENTNNLVEVTSTLQDTMSSIDIAIQSMNQNSEMLKQLGEEFEKTNQSFIEQKRDYQTAFNILTDKLTQSGETLTQTSSNLQQNLDQFTISLNEQSAKSQAQVRTSIEQFSGALTQYQTQVQTLTQTLEQNMNDFRELISQQSKDSQKQLETSINQFSDKLDSYQAGINQFSNELNRYQAGINQLTQELNQTRNNFNELTRLIQTYPRDIKAILNALQNLGR